MPVSLTDQLVNSHLKSTLIGIVIDRTFYDPSLKYVAFISRSDCCLINLMPVVLIFNVFIIVLVSCFLINLTWHH